MDKTKLADYLFQRFQEQGVEYTFGIPGDFVLPFYAAQERFGLKTAVMTHEPSIGFAADAYARLKGLGVAIVTYGAGGLNMVNPIALAYAEESPVLVISGGPETHTRSGKPQLHHCVKSFESQAKVYAEVTEAQAILTDIQSSQRQIDHVIDTVLKTSKPGYIEIPRDLVNTEFVVESPKLIAPDDNLPTTAEAVKEVIARINASQRPVFLVGSEIRRFRLVDKMVALADALRVPVVTSILGKASFPETHPNFIGTYFGQFGNPKVREYVESADLICAYGAVLTEMETGGYTAKLSANHLIQATTSDITVAHHSYSGVNLSLFLSSLLDQVMATHHKQFLVPEISLEETINITNKEQLSVLSIINELNEFISDKHIIVSDVGDCLYAGLSLKTNLFIAPGYYSSMGFGVPAGIGAQLADRSRRPIILVGDGGFQMTGMEMSTAQKMGLNPIIIVFNNASYSMLRFVDQKRDYYKLPRWDYSALAKAIGGSGVQATTKDDFKAALHEAERANGVYLIDAIIPEDDISPTLRRLTDHFSKKVKAAI